jgi:CBS domain-containing protein
MGLRAEIFNDPVSSLPLRPLIAVPRDMLLREVIAIMRRRRLGCVVIVNEGGGAEGMFSEKMLIHRMVDTPGLLDEPVGDHADTDVVSIGLNDPIVKLITTMDQGRIRWVVVVDEAGRAHSITGARGVFEYLVDHFPRCVMVHPMRSRLFIKQREGA